MGSWEPSWGCTGGQHAVTCIGNGGDILDLSWPSRAPTARRVAAPGAARAVASRVGRGAYTKCPADGSYPGIRAAAW
eukprot:356861-Chlamydomonas_euryale.AAC.9